MFKISLILSLILMNYLGICKISDGKTIVYTLPRPGVSANEDCYLDIYREDLTRDLKIIKYLGATTVMTWNGWDYDSGHKVFLNLLSTYNMSLGISFKPDLDGIMRRNLEKLNEVLVTHNITLEFVFLDFPLNFDNAEQFFQWILQVKGWMDQQGFDVPLLIRFFPLVNDENTIRTLAEKWDSGGFDAWVVEAYSTSEMQRWIVDRLNGLNKRPFFLYGADSWITANSSLNYTTQAQQLDTLLSFALDRNLENYEDVRDSLEFQDEEDEENNLAFLGSALLSFSDNLYIGNSLIYYLGSINDVCPDTNPYIKTSCGGLDKDIAYGDSFYSVEHMGLFSPYETIYYLRCLSPKLAAKTVAKAWNSNYQNSAYFTEDTCIMSFTFPHPWSHLVWGFGGSITLFILLLSCCKSCCRSCQRKSRASKTSKMQKVLVE